MSKSDSVKNLACIDWKCVSTLVDDAPLPAFITRTALKRHRPGPGPYNKMFWLGVYQDEKTYEVRTLSRVYDVGKKRFIKSPMKSTAKGLCLDAALQLCHELETRQDLQLTGRSAEDIGALHYTAVAAKEGIVLKGKNEPENQPADSAAIELMKQKAAAELELIKRSAALDARYREEKLRLMMITARQKRAASRVKRLSILREALSAAAALGAPGTPMLFTGHDDYYSKKLEKALGVKNRTKSLPDKLNNFKKYQYDSDSWAYDHDRLYISYLKGDKKYKF
jgi:hypothetical protein